MPSATVVAEELKWIAYVPRELPGTSSVIGGPAVTEMPNLMKTSSPAGIPRLQRFLPSKIEALGSQTRPRTRRMADVWEVAWPLSVLLQSKLPIGDAERPEAVSVARTATKRAA